MDKNLSRQQVQVILNQAPKGADRGKIVSGLVNRGFVLEGFNDQAPTPVQSDSFGTRTVDSAKQGFQKVQSGIEQSQNATNPIQLIEGGLKTGAGAIETAFSPVTAALAPVTKKFGEGIQKSVDEISNYPIVQKFAMSKAGETTQRVAEDVANTATIAGTVTGIEGGPILAKMAVNTGKNTATAISDSVKNLTKESEAQIESKILTNYNKGVKPTIANKNTGTAVRQYKDNVINAVQTIKENAPNLSFTDESGTAITGQTPKSLQQLSDAVEQTKKTIFTKYDTLAKQAGEAGVNVNLAPISTELDSVITNKALGISNPEAIKYAQATKARIANAGKINANTAQEVVQNYNKSLEAFYRNPSYDNASKAAIDALIANKIGQSLDEGISGLTGEQYGALKKQYGALKSIEKDVVKSASRNARLGTKGLIDFTDILSGGNVVNGILNLNPTQIAAGLTQKGIAEFYQYLNNPNRAVQNMFKATEKLPTR